MKVLKKVISVMAALVMAMSCLVISAGATAKFDMLNELKKYKLTSDTKLDSSVYGYYSSTSDHLVIYIGGLADSEAARIEELAAVEGYELSAAISFGKRLGYAYEDSSQAAIIGDTYIYNSIRKVYFTHTGSTYKLVFEVETTDNVLNELKSADKAAVSIRALNTASQIRDYYGGKRVIYIPFSDKDTGTTKISDLQISGITSRSYTGKAIRPSVTIRDGAYTLRSGKDYSLYYKDNKNVGTATITVKGKGSYTGSKKVYFKIIPRETKIVDVSLTRQELTISWDEVPEADMYYIYRSEDKGVTYKKIATEYAGTTSIVTKFPMGSKYTYRIRCSKIVKGKTYYSLYSRAVIISEQT